MSEFEKQVKIELLKRGWNMVKLAEELGISASYLYEIMKGTRKSEDQKQRIINLLGLDVNAVEQTVNQ